MYMSRLAAEKEWAFMKVCKFYLCVPLQMKFMLIWQVLHEHDFPVPCPIDHVRHCILMEYIDAYPL